MDGFESPRAPLPPLAAELAAIGDDIIRLVAPNETAFIALGDALASARGALGGGSSRFAVLSDLLERDEGAQAERTLAEGQRSLLTISSETHEVVDGLSRLDRGAGAVARPLAVLAKIIDEISALGTNAKIHAAQITAEGIDFTVFTRDIDRLHQLAAATLDQTQARLGALDRALATARQAAARFQGNDSAELERIGGRLGGQVAELSRRRQRARAALPEIESRTKVIAERVSRCISALQINDLTSQRFEHVRTALAQVAALLDEAGARAAGFDPGEGRRVAAAVCALQIEQMNRATADFRQAIEDLKSNLAGLGHDAAAMLNEARTLFGGGGDGGFIEDVAHDVDRAATLLQSYCQADERMRIQITAVSGVFAEIASDLGELRSIDADLRIMGLNATFKCGRLGSAGHALGVVAQELRACSRRTEEISRQIGGAIDAATAEAAAIAERSEQEYRTAATLAEAIGSTLPPLRLLSGELAATLTELTHACDGVARLLDDASQGFDREHSLQEGVAALARRLTAVAERAVPGGVDPASVRDQIHRLLGHHYTMSSERDIHEMFNVGESGAAAATAADAEADVDSFLF
ncbi:methyl-accepting chemotaxis protein [Phaeospirillum tilakii]|uniref:Methyl-accepting chemotaxis protein n=1 Tax=Phaeospirillum tilakii TaxID=741673 RepID=A0ABW5C7W6_9PROT